MTREEAIKMAKADLKCMERVTSGQDEMCNSHKCDECSLNYERGNMGEQKEWLRLAIKALEQEPNWIKCSEHLPKFDVDVLATTKEYGDVVKVTRWRTILKDCGWEWVLVDDTEGNAYNSDEIIAWMPLPEPYKGGGKNEYKANLPNS